MTAQKRKGHFLARDSCGRVDASLVVSADLLCISFSKVGFPVCSLLAKKTGTYLNILSDPWEPDFAKTVVGSWVAYLCGVRNVSKSISPLPTGRRDLGP